MFSEPQAAKLQNHHPKAKSQRTKISLWEERIMNLDRVIAVRNDKTIYQDGSQCVKLFNDNYSKADILNEALNQARIEDTGLSIPRILGVNMIDGKWAIVSEFIKGKTLSQLMKEEPDKKGIQIGW